MPEGLAGSDWTTIHAAYEAERHVIQPASAGWQAVNPGQQWTTIFDKRGFIVQPQHGSWQWGLELLSYGFTNSQHAIEGIPTVDTERQRLAYHWDSNLEEWFINDERGLEHGFTVAQRPEEIGISASAHRDALSFTLGVRGSLRPTISTDALGLLFADTSGATVVQYTGLKVWDADGKALDSYFELAGVRSVRLLVDEASARYPITIDPIAQQTFLKASNAGEGDFFGVSVAVSGDTVVVGAEREDSGTTGVNSMPDESATDSGAAYVFVQRAGVWTQQAYLKANNTGAGDRFGSSVAIFGDTIIVAADHEPSSTTGENSIPNSEARDSGAVYVFERNDGIWAQQAYLKASNTGAGDQFGCSVAIEDNTLVIGARLEDSSTTTVDSEPDESARDSGAAYVFVRSEGQWAQQAYLKASNLKIDDYFGGTVAVSGDTVVVGAPGDDSANTGVNRTPIIEGNAAGRNSGAAYIFVRNDGTWTEQAYVKAHNTRQSDGFGIEVALSNNTLLVGAFSQNSFEFDSGAAYVFERSEGSWKQRGFLKASNHSEDDLFGRSVALSSDGNMAVIGAIEEDGVQFRSGAAYVFVREADTWTEHTYLKASSPGSNDRFGHSIALSGNTIIVGAFLEDSDAMGVNGEPNNRIKDAGAAYIFTLASTIPYPIIDVRTEADATVLTYQRQSRIPLSELTVEHSTSIATFETLPSEAYTATITDNGPNQPETVTIRIQKDGSTARYFRVITGPQ